MNEATGCDEHSLAGQRASFKRFQIAPKHGYGVVDDFLREVFPRSIDCHGAEVEKWLEAEVPRLTDRLACQLWRWRLCDMRGDSDVSLVAEDRASPAMESVTCGTCVNEDNWAFATPN